MQETLSDLCFVHANTVILSKGRQKEDVFAQSGSAFSRP